MEETSLLLLLGDTRNTALICIGNRKSLAPLLALPVPISLESDGSSLWLHFSTGLSHATRTFMTCALLQPRRAGEAVKLCTCRSYPLASGCELQPNLLRPYRASPSWPALDTAACLGWERVSACVMSKLQEKGLQLALHGLLCSGTDALNICKPLKV